MNIDQEILSRANTHIDELAKASNISRDEYITKYANYQLSKINTNINNITPFIRLSLVLSIIISIILIILIIRNYNIMKSQDDIRYFSLDIPFSLLLIVLLVYMSLNLTKFDLEVNRNEYIDKPEKMVIENVSREIMICDYFKQNNYP